MRVLIVEDEYVAACGLEKFVREILSSKIESVRIEGNLTASECFLQDNPIDLLLLDLNLEGEDGMDLMSMAAAGSFQTIIVSANTDRALQAFEYGVLDFVPKPVRMDRLRKALEKLESGLPASGRAMNCIAVRNREEDRADLIALGDVLFFQASDNYVTVHTKDGGRHRHRKTMDALMLTLPRAFMRAHRSYIVNMNFAKGLKSVSGGKHELELKNHASLPVSREVYRDLMAALS